MGRGARNRNFDLHRHSTISTAPSRRPRSSAAAANGVTVLALTDDDEARRARPGGGGAARTDGILFVAGCRDGHLGRTSRFTSSVSGSSRQHDAAAEHLAHLRASRGRRAERIVAELRRVGHPGGCSKAATGDAENPKLIGRAYFARFVDGGVARDLPSVLRHDLVRGKPGYVPQQWADLADAVARIRASGAARSSRTRGADKLSHASSCGGSSPSSRPRAGRASRS